MRHVRDWQNGYRHFAGGMFACVAACLTTGAAVGQTPATMPPPAISSPPPAPATPHYNLGLPMFAAGADPYNLSSATTAPAPQATAATSQTALSNEYTFDTFRKSMAMFPPALPPITDMIFPAAWKCRWCRARWM